MQAEQIQRLFEAFRKPLFERKAMTPEKFEEIAKGLKEALEADPPLDLNWGYNTYIAQKSYS